MNALMQDPALSGHWNDDIFMPFSLSPKPLFLAHLSPVTSLLSQNFPIAIYSF